MKNSLFSWKKNKQYIERFNFCEVDFSLLVHNIKLLTFTLPLVQSLQVSPANATFLSNTVLESTRLAFFFTLS